ncbi:MAG: YxeA family protein [Coriobacteriales bacterium]|jgi:uncharacterized protein YxeA|nr:YxeA family protein [Coriobacteriales bacterium]
MAQNKRVGVRFMVTLAVVAVVVFAAFQVKQYCDDRYQGTDYYAKVPDIAMTLEPVRSDSGELFGLGKTYRLRASDPAGQLRDLEFLVMQGEVTRMPQPGDYLRVSASKQLVVGWSFMDKASVPQLALEKIDR